MKGNNIAAYVYVFIVKKLKYHIKKSKYYETGNWKTGGPCCPYIAHLIAIAHKYTQLRHEKPKRGSIKEHFREIILKSDWASSF